MFESFMSKPFLWGLILLSLLAPACQKESFTSSSQVEDFFHIRQGDYDIPVWVRGNTASRKILLYVQGGPAGNSFDFAAIDYPGWRQSLEKDFAVAYYDQRGTGNRQGQFSVGADILDTYLVDLHQVCRFLEKAYEAEVILLGHSFGGGLVLRYMIKYGQSGIPSKYIALNAPASTDLNSATQRWAFRRSFLANTAHLEISRERHVQEWQEVLSWLEKHPVIEKISGPNPYQLFNEWNAFVEELVYRYYPEKSLAWQDYLKVLFRSPYNPLPAYLGDRFADNGIGSLIIKAEEDNQLINQLHQIDHQAVLLITGRFDDICVPEELDYIYQQVTSPLKQREIFDLAGHDLPVHQPQALHNAIKNFIR